MDAAEHGADPLVATAAQVALAQLMRRVGVIGLTAMAACPGLVARVDQHAAEVRDALVDASGQVPAVRLAAYADGVADAAARRGWTFDDALAEDWTRASWPLVRLLAVCELSRSFDGIHR